MLAGWLQDLEKSDKAKTKIVEEIKQRETRVVKLDHAKAELQLHRQLMVSFNCVYSGEKKLKAIFFVQAKGRRKLVKPRTSNSIAVYKWKTERKK